jgi:hypothetical protein
VRTMIWLVVLSLFSCLGWAAAPTAQSVLMQSKAASGGNAWNRVHSIKLEGKANAGGLSGSFEQLENVNNGASVLQYKLGPADVRLGFDGSTSWNQGPSGDVALQDSAAGKQIAASDAYLAARAYWFPQRWPATVRFCGTRTDSGRAYQVLRALPKGGDAIELWIDPSTHLIARIVESTGGRGRTQIWSDYRTVDGVKQPFRIEAYTGDDVAHKSVALVDHVSINVDVPANRFAPPQQDLHDFAFLDGGNRATIPIEIFNNHVYLPVTINGHVLHFMFDTGGRNLLTPEAAAKAGVKSVGEFGGGGVGKKVVNLGLAKVAAMTVGDKISLRNQAFIVEPLPHFDQIEGTEFDGLIGYEILKRLVARIDYAGRTVTFIRPSNFSSAHADQRVPFTFFGSTPMVNAMLDGLSGQFEVDTGSRAGLTLWTPFVQAHQLVKRYQASPETTIGWGVGGKAVGHVARGSELLLGNIKIEHPVLTMQNHVTSPNSVKDDDGNIGGAILRRFTLTLDYDHHALYLQPNKDFLKPFEYDRSGMWINQGDGGFVVESVLVGGLAGAAGLQVGDVIVALDGTPAGKIALSDWRQSLREEKPGTRIRLEVRRAGVTETIDLVLHDLIPGS